MVNIWIDDMRIAPPLDNLVEFRAAEDAVIWLIENDNTSETVQLWLDHDLGSGKLSGYEFCKWLVEWNFNNDHWAAFKFHILSANPVGVFNMRQLLTHYGYTEF